MRLHIHDYSVLYEKEALLKKNIISNVIAQGVYRFHVKRFIFVIHVAFTRSRAPRLIFVH